MVSCRLLAVTLLLVFLLHGCGDEPVSPPAAPRAGEQTMRVTARVYDEFEREIEAPGDIAVTLSGSDRILHATIPRGGASKEFLGLPLESYILSAHKDGYYPYETIAGRGEGTSDWLPVVRLYPLPPPAFRIDSITVGPAPGSSKTLMVTLHTAESAPSSYAWGAVVFYSTSPSIDPSGVSYDLEEVTSQYGGDQITTFESKNTFTGYPFWGKRVYVTARLLTPASESFFDSTALKTRYRNLESNTSVVGSFIP